MFEGHMLRIEIVEIPVQDGALLGIANLVFSARQRRHDEERHDIEAKLAQGSRRDTTAIRSIERKPEHVACVHRYSGTMPIIDHAPVLLEHSRARVLQLQPMLP